MNKKRAAFMLKEDASSKQRDDFVEVFNEKSEKAPCSSADNSTDDSNAPIVTELLISIESKLRVMLSLGGMLGGLLLSLFILRLFI